jgi:hypothetical protein
MVAKRNYFRRMAVDWRWNSLSIMLGNREFITIILSDKVLRHKCLRQSNALNDRRSETLRGVSKPLILRKALCQVSLFLQSGQRELEICQTQLLLSAGYMCPVNEKNPNITRVAPEWTVNHVTRNACLFKWKLNQTYLDVLQKELNRHFRWNFELQSKMNEFFDKM